MTNIQSAVQSLIQRLTEVQDIWAITGGCNLYLRGCINCAKDIDIVTSKQGVVEIARKLDGQVMKIQKTEAENVRSYFFSTEMNGVKIEVMGDPENKINGIWILNSTWVKLIEFIQLNNMLIPVESLEYEFLIDNIIGNINRANLIKNCITNQSN